MQFPRQQSNVAVTFFQGVAKYFASNKITPGYVLVCKMMCVVEEIKPMEYLSVTPFSI